MELVYLWVENYKNIENQGFNFSPRYKCSYEKNKLIIVDKEETNEPYLKNFFGENINITTIVGENGSGKSNILVYINEYLSKIILEPGSFSNDLVVVLLENVIYILASHKISIDCSHKNELIIIPKFQMGNKIDNSRIVFFLDQFFGILYNFHITSNNNNLQYATKNYPDRRLSPVEIEKNDLRLITYKILEKENEYQYFGDFFSPDQIIIQSNSLYDLSLIKKDFNNLSFLSDELDNKSNIDKFLFVIYTFLSSLLVRFTPNDSFEALKNVNSLQSFEKTLEKKISTLVKTYTEARVIQTNNLNYKPDLLDIAEMLDYTKKIKNDNVYAVELFGPNQMTNLYNGIKFSLNTFRNTEKKYYYIFENLPVCFDINFKDTLKNVEYLSLSSGEKSVTRIRYYIETVIKKSQQKNFIFLFDELDTEIHPQWQKNIINNLVNIFRDREEKFHFVLTTHSPFLLSDLPKDNVVFLKKGKQVSPDIDTFGANIHTLLSHGFFMQDGLMGEFAKEKINQIINYLNDKESEITNNETAQKYINLIGEPILKRQLQKMLDSKRISRMDEIDELKRRIELLESKQ